jgi:lipopolysaccharide biosynthesis glycosyltransferase
MDIAFAFDEAYADPAQVAIESVLDCHRHRDDLTLWLLTTERVAKQRTAALERQVDGRARLRLLSTGDEFRALPLSCRPTLHYITAATYLRLLLPELVPAGLDRMLYLDSDVLVVGDLAPLWKVDLGDAPFAAVRDAFTQALGDRDGIPGAGTGHDAAAPYFNAGVLLMHLPVWRRLRVTERCRSYLDEYADRLRLADQDALNLVGYGRWRQLPSAWNIMLYLSSLPEDPVPAQDVRILHFVGPGKPWLGERRRGYGQDRYHALAERIGGFPG